MAENTVINLAFTPGLAYCEQFIASITELDSASYSLDCRRSAVQAASCLLTPGVGDRVLCTTMESGDESRTYILSVLERHGGGGGDALLQVPSADSLTLAAQRVQVMGARSVGISTLGDMELNSGAGTLTVVANNLFQSVSANLVQQAGHWIARAADYSLKVAGVLQQHGQQNIITADQDVRIDAERINMG